MRGGRNIRLGVAFLCLAACAKPHIDGGFGSTWKSTNVAPGVVFKQREFSGDLFDSKQRISVLEVDLTVPSVSVKPIMVAVPGKCERTSELAERTGAVAAVNHWLCCGRKWTCQMNTLFKNDGVSAHTQIDWGAGATYAFGVTKDHRAVIAAVEPGSDWPEAAQAGTGYGLVLRDGKLSIEYVREKYNYEPPFWLDRHPRKGVCTVDKSHIKFLAVDGRSETAQGMTLKEFGEVMRQLGCRDGLNLDGGGSTTMWVEPSGEKGRVTNFPSDTDGERPVVSAWGIFSGQ